MLKISYTNQYLKDLELMKRRKLPKSELDEVVKLLLEQKPLPPKHKSIDVQSVTRDLSQSYDWFCRQVFYDSLYVEDKFHIIKQLLDACQDVRVRYRQELLTDKRLKYEAFKKTGTRTKTST